MVLVLAASAYGQQLDVAIGAGTLTAPSASDASGNHSPVSLNGGTYLNFSGDYLFLLKGRLGASSEIAWRASRSIYDGSIPYRPFYYDFNAIYVPQLSRSFSAELQAGIGGQDTRFYNPAGGGGFGRINFVSSNHFMGHFSAGIRAYLHGNFFVRPEAHLYLVRNNVEFSSGRATRFAVSLGYSFGRP